MPYNVTKKFIGRKLFSGAIALSSQLIFAHGDFHNPSDEALSGPRGLTTLNWQAPNISRTITAGYPDTLGISSFLRRELPTLYKHNNKQCIKANFVAFDIDDNFAYNIDETVEVTLSFDAAKTDTVFFGFDANGTTEAIGDIKHQSQNQTGLFTKTITLDRARFANRGINGSDFALTAEGTYSFDKQDQLSTFGLCDIRFKRSNTSKPEEQKKSQLTINWRDEGKPTAVRFGIYDETGRAVLASQDAVDIHFYQQARKEYALVNYQPKSQPWPHSNRYISYADGQYQVTLPAGDYQIIASKGPEYHVVKHDISITQGQDKEQTIDLIRWQNMPDKGWHSGDVHIHMKRDTPMLNASIMSLLQAEDVHVSNLLLMNNPGGGHYDQYAYGEAGHYIKDIHSIIPGIESPRTAQRGHTIALNIKKPIIDPDNYFLYHKFMDSYHQQNAVNGYAHVGSKEFNASWGLALDVPFGLVDFVEIMQNSELRTDFWYEFLSLGYRLAPASGSDFPYFDQPGAVRSYAKTNEHSKPSTQKWFDALKKGNTFVTNGPILEFTVNNNEMGSTLNTQDKPITIEASASINPDFDSIKSLEVLSCGKVIKRIEAQEKQQTLNLKFELTATDSQWLAVRADGNTYAMAHSNPIYITDKSGFSGCKDQVKPLQKIMLDRLDALATSPIKVYKELEYWQTTQLEERYNKQLPQLLKRIEKAKAFYQ